jgi:N utilization substance protein B
MAAISAGPDPAAKPSSFNPSRRRSRRRALDVLYSADLRSLAPATVLAELLDRMQADRPAHMAYAIELVEGVQAHLPRIDELLATYAEGWTLDRMPVVDRNLCRIAVFELLWCADIDDAVAISEAVELAAQLSTDSSPRFVNGVLSRIAQFAAPD